MSESEEVEFARLDALETAGICSLCEKAPAAADDCFCAVCRQGVIDRSSEVVDPVEQALNKHWTMTPLCTTDHQLCRCGWSIDGGPAYHRRHVAEQIYGALQAASLDRPLPAVLNGPAPWVDGPLVTHPTPNVVDV